MINTYKVLLPGWVFKAQNDREIESNIKQYLQRYPHYIFKQEVNGFALCERK